MVKKKRAVKKKAKKKEVTVARRKKKKKGGRGARHRQRKAQRQMARAYLMEAGEQLRDEGEIDDTMTKQTIRELVHVRAEENLEDDGNPFQDLIRQLFEQIGPIIIQLIIGWLNSQVGGGLSAFEDDE